MINIGDALLYVGVDMKDMESGLNNIGQKIQSGLGTSMKAVGIGLLSVGTAAVGVGIASVKSFAEMADNLDEMSQRTGMSAETLQELGYAAKLSGGSLEGLEGAIKKMQVNISMGSKAVETLGIDLTSLQGLTPKEQLEKLADLISNIQDPAERTAMAVKIFGKSGTELLPILQGGSKGLADWAKEARDLGIVMDDTSVKAGGEFNDLLDKMAMQFQGLTNQLGAALLPALEPLIPTFIDLIKALPMKEIGELIKSLLPPLVELFLKLLKAIPVDIIVKFVTTALTPMLKILEAILPVLEPILDLVGKLLTVLTPIMEVIGKIVSYVVQLVASGLTTGLSWLSSLFGGGEVTEFRMPALPSFAGFEGIIPGTPGTPILATVHAGERIGQGSGTIITGNNFYIREESDIQKIARELYRMQQLRV